MLKDFLFVLAEEEIVFDRETACDVVIADEGHVPGVVQ